jgi:hypothetical protein
VNKEKVPSAYNVPTGFKVPTAQTVTHTEVNEVKQHTEEKPLKNKFEETLRAESMKDDSD